MATYTTAQLSAALLASTRTWSFRYDVVAPDGSVRGQADVESASVANNDLADKAKRTGQFVISPRASINYFTDRLRPYALLRMPDGGWAEWPLGTFHLTTRGTRRAVTGQGSVPVEAYDSLLVLDEDAVLDRYVVTAGTNYRTAVVSLLNGAGFPTTQIATTDKTLPAAKEWPPGTSKLEIVNTLLAGIDYKPLVMDALGVPTAGPYVDPLTAAVSWTYAVDRSSVIVPGVDVALDLWNVPNAWIATVSEPDRPVLTSVLVNSDPASILSTVSRGRTIVARVEPDAGVANEDGTTEAVDQATLDAKVARVAAEASQQYQTADFATGLMPFHGSGDVCLIDYGDGPLRFREHEWSMELKAGGLMTHKFRRVVTL